MNGRSRSGLFLMELIIAIAFFAVSSAICVQLFATAHTLSAKSHNVGMAISNAQSAAECFKSTYADVTSMAKLLNASSDNDMLVARYDESWQMTDSDGRFALTIELDIASSPATATIFVTDTLQGEVLHHLVVKKHVV